jgi:hypothetical protein
LPFLDLLLQPHQIETHYLASSRRLSRKNQRSLLTFSLHYRRISDRKSSRSKDALAFNEPALPLQLPRGQYLSPKLPLLLLLPLLHPL